MQKTSLAVSVQDILSNGGCKISSLVHANGDEWHPVIASHGEQKCIKCRCKVITFFLTDFFLNLFTNYYLCFFLGWPYNM